MICAQAFVLEPHRYEHSSASFAVVVVAAVVVVLSGVLSGELSGENNDDDTSGNTLIAGFFAVACAPSATFEASFNRKLHVSGAQSGDVRATEMSTTACSRHFVRAIFDPNKQQQ